MGGDHGRKFRRGVVDHLASYMSVSTLDARGTEDPVLTRFIQHGPDRRAIDAASKDPTQHPVRAMLAETGALGPMLEMLDPYLDPHSFESVMTWGPP